MSEIENQAIEQPEPAPLVEQPHSVIPHPTPASNTTIKRVYFTNIPAEVSESILTAFLKEYEPTSVLIPYQYVTRYSGRKTVVPLGLAYADFATPEVANKVVLEHLNKQTPAVNNESVDNPEKPGSPQINDKNESTPEKSESPHASSPIAYSKTWIYVSNLSAGTLDTDLAEHFKEYLPNDIYLFQFKSKKHRGKFFQKTHLSAIINLPAVEDIENIAEYVSKKTHLSKIRNAKISVQPCIEKKVTEVIEAAKIKEPTVQETMEEQVSANPEQISGEQKEII
ncbi:hypothetical protein ACO0OE_004026 [Hanseniaspora uvarum]